ncbi:MAG: hypothetical protein COW66_02695 [Flavobacteriaceae bacterium CG18_big_fil_WC_8_21_14_2_50_34_36]|nr:MAG: hypothetical protein COW66_02695 [Flavobacteriaceae bacterium CG18_big_fil_WC_8_21_14_2_50_34_36]
MNTDNIQALGNLLGGYNSDLLYIRNFQRHKNGELGSSEYLIKSNGMFQSFLNEFRVARNIDKTKRDVLLMLTMDWVNLENPHDVDGFAKLLNREGITHGKTMTSLASKILFLNDPWTILPLDSLAKKTVRLKNNIYSDYLPLTFDFQEKNKKEMKECLMSIDKHLNIIEAPFQYEIHKINIIRQNRYTDKILWTIGRKK